MPPSTLEDIFLSEMMTLPSPPSEDHTQSYQAYNNQLKSALHHVPE